LGRLHVFWCGSGPLMPGGAHSHGRQRDF
jgi:hypothetical protein